MNANGKSIRILLALIGAAMAVSSCGTNTASSERSSGGTKVTAYQSTDVDDSSSEPVADNYGNEIVRPAEANSEVEAAPIGDPVEATHQEPAPTPPLDGPENVEHQEVVVHEEVVVEKGFVEPNPELAQVEQQYEPPSPAEVRAYVNLFGPYEYAQVWHPADVLGPAFNNPDIYFNSDVGLYATRGTPLVFSPDARYLINWYNGTALDFPSSMRFDPRTRTWQAPPPNAGSGYGGSERVWSPGGDSYVGGGSFFDSDTGCSVIVGGGLSC